MKVICIDNSETIYGKNDELEIGAIYTVVNSFTSCNILAYQLQEFPSPTMFHGYNSNKFLPISDIDETELVNEKILVNDNSK